MDCGRHVYCTGSRLPFLYQNQVAKPLATIQVFKSTLEAEDQTAISEIQFIRHSLIIPFEFISISHLEPSKILNGFNKSRAFGFTTQLPINLLFLSY
jgi:hypothetical protein